MEMLSRPLPYTELLKIVSGKLIKAALLLNNIQKRTVARVGIISTTQIADEDIPPGISRFIKYVYRPWRGGIDHYNLNITSILEENSGALDRCIHQIVRPEDREKLTTLQFDWQRLFRTEKALASDSLGDIVDAAQKSALRYFEEVAEGSKFDEEILRATAPA